MSNIRVGSLVYATDSGLGILAKAFYDHGIVTDPMVVIHAHHPSHLEWYPDALVTPIRPFDYKTAADFLSTMDVVLFFESPFDWSLMGICRERGVKTVLMVNYECTPRSLPCKPDLFLCPSTLDHQYYPDREGSRSIYLPIPVEVPWRQRERALTFVHNAGHLGLRGRNSTNEFMDALHYVKSHAKFILRYQETINKTKLPYAGDRIDIRFGTADYATLWDEGDVFLFPEKFNGLSLPLQEARAAGMLVMGTDRFPMNHWLPTEPLIKPIGYAKARVGAPYNDFDEAIINPKDIAAKIDQFYGIDISGYSRQGKGWAATMSWDVLGSQYRKVMEDLL